MMNIQSLYESLNEAQKASFKNIFIYEKHDIKPFIDRLRLDEMKIEQALLTILSEVCNLSLEDICSESRKTEYVIARTIIMRYCAIRLDYTWKKSGGLVNRDHATAMHAVNKTHWSLCHTRKGYVKLYASFELKANEYIRQLEIS